MSGGNGASSEKILAIAVIVALATGVFIGKNFLSRIKTEYVETSGDPALISKNHLLSIKIDGLTKDLEESLQNCNAEVKKAQYLKEMNDAEGEKAKIEASKIDKQAEERQKSENYLAKVRNGGLTLSEWQKLLFGHTKDGIFNLLGKPDKIINPSGDTGYSTELWKYSGKVRVEASTSKKDLLINVSNGNVSKVESSSK